ncbi:hypothetical protein D3C80_1831750 [compost metagenome]
MFNLIVTIFASIGAATNEVKSAHQAMLLRLIHQPGEGVARIQTTYALSAGILDKRSAYC